MATITEAVTAKRVRIESVDIVRGVIMIVMALDHVRDFFGYPGVNPTDPANHDHPTILHALDYPFLRARFLLAYRNGRLSLATKKV